MRLIEDLGSSAGNALGRHCVRCGGGVRRTPARYPQNTLARTRRQTQPSWRGQDRRSCSQRLPKTVTVLVLVRRSCLNAGLSRWRPRVRVPSTPLLTSRKSTSRESATRYCGLSFRLRASRPVCISCFRLAVAAHVKPAPSSISWHRFVLGRKSAFARRAQAESN